MGYNIILYKYIQRHRRVKDRGERGYRGEREPVATEECTVGIAWVLLGVVKGRCL